MDLHKATGTGWGRGIGPLSGQWQEEKRSLNLHALLSLPVVLFTVCDVARRPGPEAPATHLGLHSLLNSENAFYKTNYLDLGYSSVLTQRGVRKEPWLEKRRISQEQRKVCIGNEIENDFFFLDIVWGAANIEEVWTQIRREYKILPRWNMWCHWVLLKIPQSFKFMQSEEKLHICSLTSTHTEHSFIWRLLQPHHFKLNQDEVKG